jgi:hypothetical protein
MMARPWMRLSETRSDRHINITTREGQFVHRSSDGVGANCGFIFGRIKKMWWTKESVNCPRCMEERDDESLAVHILDETRGRPSSGTDPLFHVAALAPTKETANEASGRTMRTVTVMTVALYDVEFTDPRIEALIKATRNLAELSGMERPVLTIRTHHVGDGANRETDSPFVDLMHPVPGVARCCICFEARQIHELLVEQSTGKRWDICGDGVCAQQAGMNPDGSEMKDRGPHAGAQSQHGRGGGPSASMAHVVRGGDQLGQQ